MKELMNNFSKQHNYFKTITLASLIGLVLCILSSAFFYFKLINEKNSVTFIAIDGMVYKAVAHENYNYPERKYEIMQSVKEFYFNRYSGDRYSYTDNIRIALEYCGDCSSKILNDYHEEGMSKNIRERDWTYTAYLDSVIFTDNSYLSGYAFGRQLIRNNAQEILRNIYISFDARSISRSERNLLGVLFDDIELFNNKVLETKNR